MSSKVHKALSNDKIGAILALHREGLSYKMISERLNMTKSTAHFWVKRAKSDPSDATRGKKVAWKEMKNIRTHRKAIKTYSNE